MEATLEDMDTPLDKLVTRICAFRDARDMRKFHTLQNLIASVNIEASELLELTQWKSASEIEEMPSDPHQRSALEQETADILIYLLLLADTAGFDIIEAANCKLDLNEKRYPSDKSRGRATKYTKL